MDKWISVKDRLPEDDEIKLVWFAKVTHFPDLSYGWHELAWYCCGKWGNTDHDDIEYNNDYRSVTHWMELPEQPLK